MVEVRWTPQAASDLEAIAAFIGADSDHYASLFVCDIFAVTERLARFPRLGRVLPEKDEPTIREVILGSYRIVYRFGGELVEILTIHHGARLLNPDQLS